MLWYICCRVNKASRKATIRQSKRIHERMRKMLNLPEVKTELAVIQATPFCNINCRYCYLPNRLSIKRMDNKTLARIFEVLFSSSFLSDHVSIVWHAGEPLVLPIAFYEQAFQIAAQFNRHRVHITHCFQTNGTLINQTWCDFIKHYNV